MIDVGLFLSYILIGLCAVAAIVMPLIKALDDPQSLKKSLIGIGVLVIVMVIAYVIADGTVYEKADTATSKRVGAGLITFYILTVVAIGGIIYTEIKKAIG